MSLKAQRRLASELLKVGQNRVWMDPDRVEDIQSAITKSDVRKLIYEGTVRKRRAGVGRGFSTHRGRRVLGGVQVGERAPPGLGPGWKIHGL